MYIPGACKILMNKKTKYKNYEANNLFVYDGLFSNEDFRKLFPSVKKLGSCALSGYRLMYWPNKDKYVAIPDKRSLIIGDVYRVVIPNWSLLNKQYPRFLRRVVDTDYGKAVIYVCTSAKIKKELVEMSTAPSVEDVRFSFGKDYRSHRPAGI